MKDYLRQMTGVFADHYLKSKDVWSEDLGLRRTTELLLKMLSGRSRILDIGCGNGTDVRRILHAGHVVHGIDLVAHSRWVDIAAEFQKRVSFSVCGFQTFREEERFDAILDNGCFHHQTPEDQLLYLRKIAQLLLHGGIFAINVYTPRDAGRPGVLEKMADGRWARAYNLDQLEAAMALGDLRVLFFERVRSSVHGGSYLIALCRKE